MIDINSISGYKFYDHLLDQHNLLLLPVLLKILNKNNNLFNKNIFDLGCGNGSVANFLSKYNWDPTLSTNSNSELIDLIVCLYFSSFANWHIELYNPDLKLSSTTVIFL